MHKIYASDALLNKKKISKFYAYDAVWVKKLYLKGIPKKYEQGMQLYI